MRLRYTTALMLVGLCSVPIAPRYAFADERQDAAAALARVEQNKRKIEAIIIAEAVARIADRNNSGLAYIAVNLGAASDPNSLHKVFDGGSRNGDVDPLMTDDQALALARTASARIPGLPGKAANSLATAIAADATAHAAQGAHVLFSPETQTAALLGAFQGLPNSIRDDAYKGLASYLNLDYDGMRQKVEQNAVLTPNSRN